MTQAQRDLERALLTSRAEWLWRNSTTKQREACFHSGLGRKPGLFIHAQLDVLVDVLCALQGAVAARDRDAAAEAAVQFAQRIMPEPFFSVRRLPDNWETAIAGWVKGTAFSELLSGRNAGDAQRMQALTQDGVVFRLVWAAEAARVQAIATDHPRGGELGDGPPFVLTYGVPTIPAALLCQMGFASRVGAVWVTRQLAASFTDTEGLHAWLRENRALLKDPHFGESVDHHLMWTHASAPSGADYPQPWGHQAHEVSGKRNDSAPQPDTLTRIIVGTGRTATVCGLDLSPLGTAQVPFDPHGAALEGRVASGGKMQIQYFGPGG